MRIAFWIVLSLVAMVIIGGCGGSTESTLNKTLLSEPDIDGQATATSVVTDQDRAIIGDDASNAGMRAFVSFDLTDIDIPPGAIIDSATLEIYQANNVDAQAAVTGPPAIPAVDQVTSKGNPYGAVDADPDKGLGPVVVEHVYYGDTLTTAAYDMAPLSVGVTGNLATTWVLGYKQIDVTAAVLDDIANAATRSHSQFRISHFDATVDPAVAIETNGNSLEDSDAWVMGEGQGVTLNHKPGLVILYHLATP